MSQNTERRLLVTAFLVFLLLYIRYAIQPEWIYQAREPVFFATSRFFAEFIGYPGGFLAYADALVTQFFVDPWIGAILVTLLIGGTVCLTRIWLNRILPGNNTIWMSLIPGLFLLMLHSHYHHPLGMTVGLLLSLAGLALFTCIPLRNAAIRAVLYLLIAGILFHLGTGAMLTFAILGALSEWIANRSWRGLLFALCLAGAAVIIPWIATRLVLIKPAQAYLTHLWTETRYPVEWALPGLYIAFLTIGLSPVWLPLVRKGYASAIGDPVKKVKILNRNLWIVRFILFSLFIWIAIRISLNQNTRTLYRVIHHTREKNWSAVLDAVAANPSNHILIQHLSDRALFHSGRLLDDLFTYPHGWGKQGLFLSYKFNYSAPEHMCDFCMDIGHLNEAEHWAWETLTLNGETPWILKQLAEINLLKGEPDMALTFINRLEQTLLHRSWAKDCRRLAQNLAGGRSDAYPQSLERDFIISKHKFDEDIDHLQNLMPENRMVFEYNIASHLFDKDLDGLYDKVNRLNHFNIRIIPRHWQEALILMMLRQEGARLKLSGHKLNSELIQNLQNFQQILMQKSDDRMEAYEVLGSTHGNTFWYYLIFEEVSGHGK